MSHCRSINRIITASIAFAIAACPDGASAAQKYKRRPFAPQRAVRAAPDAAIALDYADDTSFGLSITTRSQEVATLDFQWNAELKHWQPIFATDGIEETAVGADLESWVDRRGPQSASVQHPQMISPSIVEASYDDVTILSLPRHELVFLCLWQNGEVAATYFAISPSDEMLNRARRQTQRDAARTSTTDEAIFPTLCYFIDCFCFTGSRFACLISTLMGCVHSCLP